jgi:hypothetical protein
MGTMVRPEEGSPLKKVERVLESLVWLLAQL